MPIHTDSGIPFQHLRLSRRQTLHAGIALAFGTAFRPGGAASQETPGEISMPFANPARTNVFDEPGPAGDPVVVRIAQLDPQAPAVPNEATQWSKVPQAPVVTGGLIVIGAAEGVIALDQATGERRWRFQAAATAPEMLGASVVTFDGLIYAVNDQGVLYALDPESGDKQWELRGVSELAQPTYADGLIYLPANQPLDGPTEAATGNRFLAVEAATGTIVWEAKMADAIHRWPACADDRVFTATWNGEIHALDDRTGERLWTYTPPPSFLTSNLPVVANGLLYSKLWEPNTHGGEAFLALDAASGTEVFRTGVFRSSMSYPTVSATTVYLGTPEGILHAIDAGTGAALWQYNAGEVINWNVYLAGDTLYLDTFDYLLHAIDPSDGTVRWTLPIDAPISYGLDISDRQLYFATDAGTLWTVGGSDAGAVPLDAAPVTPVATEATPAPGLGFDLAATKLRWTAAANAGLVSPCAAAIDPGGSLHVVDGGTNAISIFDADGTYLETWAADFRFGNGDLALGGIAFDEIGSSYVSDSLNHRIQVFDATRTLVATIGGEGDGPGQFRFPVAVMDRAGLRLIVADSGNSRVQILGLDGQYLDQWGGPGDLNGQFRQPQAIAIGPDDSVYVADPVARRIQHFTSGGTWLGELGTPDQLGDVTGVAADRAGNVYAASPSRGAVLIYGPDATLYGAITDIEGAGPLGAPRHLLLDSRNDLYVLTGGESGGRVLKLGLTPTSPP